MNIRTVLVLFICITISHSAAAQVQWGIRTGGNLSAMLVNTETGYIKVKLRPGFHIGGTADIRLSDQFYVQPALLFTTKGFKADKDGFAQQIYGADYIQFTSYHIDLPVNLVFKPRVGNGRMLLGAGPYISYGVGGRWKAVSQGVGITGNLKFINDFSSTDSSLQGNSTTFPYTKPFDIGVNMLIGYEFDRHFYFQLNGQLGLRDIDPTYDGLSDETSSLKTVQGGISIGYKF